MSLRDSWHVESWNDFNLDILIFWCLEILNCWQGLVDSWNVEGPQFLKSWSIENFETLKSWNVELLKLEILHLQYTHIHIHIRIHIHIHANAYSPTSTHTYSHAYANSLTLTHTHTHTHAHTCTYAYTYVDVRAHFGQSGFLFACVMQVRARWAPSSCCFAPTSR